MLGASTAAGAALLLYTTRGFLGTAGFLFGITLAAIALGSWVATERFALRRRLVGAGVAYAAACMYAVLWTYEAALRRSGLGGALGVLFLLAEPAYTVAAALAALAHSRRIAVPAFLGAGCGVVTAALFLIPRLQPSVIFLAAAVVLLIVALIETRRAGQPVNAMDFSLSGTGAIVTGVGERGQVGFAVAEALVRSGARVCVSGLSAAVAELARELGAEAVQADLLNQDDVERLIRTAHDRLGRIDILVNVAGGLSVIKPLGETSAAEWEREIRRNAETAFLVSKAALPHLRAARGAIINFASPAGVRAVAQLGAYSAGKAAVIAFTRALAIEEQGRVRVNAIAPGMIDTEQNRASVADPSTVKWVTRDQIADTVMFLASEAASGITGETIHVPGEGIA